MMFVALFYDKEPWSSLCVAATGSPCYHVGFTDGVHLWDMDFRRRRRLWTWAQAGSVRLAPCPVPWLDAAFLDARLDTDATVYGFLDYAWFAVRRLAQLLRLPIRQRNFKGQICSEMVANDLRLCGWTPPAWFPEVPSPADLEEALLGRRDYNRSQP